MRRLVLVFILFLFTLPSFAQENEQTPYEIALARIEEARVSGARGLDLSGMQLTELPSEIGSLTELVRLNISYNFLNTLPSEIGNLRNLQGLYANHNLFTSLPSVIGNLNNLRTLEFYHNEILELPNTIGNLKKLCIFRLDSSQLRYLPVELAQIENLGTETCPFYIAGDSLISPPQEVIAEGTPAILAYLRNEAWWHLQRLIAGGASSLGLVAAIVLAFRWKNRRGKAKAKRA